MRIAQTIEQKLTAAFAPMVLSIVDDSASHAGHAGAKAASAAHPGGETHFNIRIVAAAFEGKSRVQRQRLVYGILAEELAGPVHALSLTTAAPSEA